MIIITAGRAKAQYPPVSYLSPWAGSAPSMFSPFSPAIPGYGPSPFQSYGTMYPGGNIPYGSIGSYGLYPSSFNNWYYPSSDIRPASYGSPAGYPSFYGSWSYPAYNPGPASYGSLGSYGFAGPYSSPYGGYYSPYVASASYFSPLSDPPEYIRDVEVIDDYAYLLSNRQNDLFLKAVDITDPDDPQIEKSLRIGDSANFSELHVQGDYLYWLSLHLPRDVDDDDSNISFSDGIEMGSIDISTPDDPRKLDTFDTGLDSAYTLKENIQAHFYQDRAYIYYVKIKKGSTYLSGLAVIDLSDPQNLHQSSFGEISWPNNRVPYIDIITAHDSLLFLCSYDNDSEVTSLYFVDISNPGLPAMEASLELPETRRPEGLIIIGHYLYLLGSNRVITVINIQDLTQPQVITALELPDPQVPMILEDNLLYIADGSRGLVVLDVTSPDHPRKQAGYRLMETDRSKTIDFIEVRGNLVFGTTTSSCLGIWDISDPEEVKEEGEIQLYAGSLPVPEYPETPTISGRLLITLTHEAQELVDLDKDGDIALFGIDSLDQLNRSYEVYKISPPEVNADEFQGQNDRPTRKYTIHFPKSVDLYEIRDAYEEKACCVIVEFQFEIPPPDTSYGIPGYFGYGWNTPVYAATYGFPSATYGSYPLMPSGYQPSSYGLNQPAYGWNQPSYGWNQPSYDLRQPYSYGWNQPSYGWNQPSYGWNQPSYGWNQPYSYGWNQPAYGWNQPYFGY